MDRRVASDSQIVVNVLKHEKCIVAPIVVKASQKGQSFHYLHLGSNVGIAGHYVTDRPVFEGREKRDNLVKTIFNQCPFDSDIAEFERGHLQQTI